MHPDLINRIQQFRDEYDDPYAPYVTELLREAHDLLERVFGFEAVDSAMWGLHERLFGEPRPDDVARWDVSMLRPEQLSQVAMSRWLADLHAYAYYGIVLPAKEDGTLGDPSHFAFFSSYHELLDSAPRSWSGLQPISQTLAVAEDRLTIDGLSSQTTVSSEGLAALAKVSVKTIKNLLAPSSGSDLRADADGQIPVKDAIRWLATRAEFLPSVWQLAEISGAAELPASVSNDTELDDVLFLPVARDGTPFRPELARDGRYTVGPKGAEVQIEDYREALQRLSRMPRPCWRRPNENGNWGIVVGTSWERKAATELGL